MVRRTSRAPPSPHGSDARRTDRRSGVGMEGNATTGPLANLLAQLCKPADAECMCNALVPASRAWSHRKLQPRLLRTPRAEQRPQAPPKRRDFVAVRGAAATSLRNPLPQLDSATGQCIPCARLVSGGVMKCVACGAGMRLMQVETDTVAVCGIEPHLQVLSLPTRCPTADVQPRQNVEHPSARRRGGASGAAGDQASSRACCASERRVDESNRKTQQQADGAQGAKTSGSAFEPAVSAQGNQERADRAENEISGSPVLDLDQRSREASSQANRARTCRNGQNQRYGRRIQPHVGRSAPGCDDRRTVGLADAPRAARVLSAPSSRLSYALRLSGTLPPLSASLVMTCRCSQRFISAEPSRAPE